MNNEIYKLMNNYKILLYTEIIILIIPKMTLMNYIHYKWTWWLYNDSIFKWSEMKQGYGNLFIFKIA
jgi:hypothetical protein